MRIALLLATVLLGGCATTAAQDRAGAILVVAGGTTAAVGVAGALGTCSPSPDFCAESRPGNPALGMALAGAGLAAVVVGLVFLATPPPRPAPPAFVSQPGTAGSAW